MGIHATVIGNLGKDAETRTVGSGKLVTNFSVASKAKKDGPTTWVRAAMWGERGKRVSEYLTKGSKVAVAGQLSTREHDGKTYVELDVHELELLGGKPAERQPGDDSDLDEDRAF
jgi:single-strand DNA-binding protein